MTRALVSLCLLAVVVSLVPAQGEAGRKAVDELERKIKELEAELARRKGPADRGGVTSPGARMANWERHVRMRGASPFKDLRWQFLGPTNISGRITDVAVPPRSRGRTYDIWLATASGGVWRSRNEGTTWEPALVDIPTTSIGDVTIAPSDPNIIWVGTGEANIFRSSMAGCGVYKSTDDGKTWTHMGLGATHTIPRIVIHPQNPSVVYVAASGHEWTDNEERGVYKTTDGGNTWRKTLYVNPRAGAIDLVMHPTDPDVLWCSTWHRIRKRWHDPRNEPDYDGSGVWKSTDGGETWKPANDGLPKPAHRGRIGLDVCRARPDVLYAFVDDYELGEKPEGRDSYGRERKASIKGAQIYRSDDGGAKWRKVSEDGRLIRRVSATYGWVFGQIRVDPNDADRIYVMGVPLIVSDDGGKTYRRLSGMHGDHHAMWIDPENSNYIINGNDGGVAISYDRGRNWRTFYDNLPVVQFYNVAYDMATPFRVYGSIQDHGSRRGVVDLSRGRDRIRARDWERAPGGEASYHAVDPTDPDVVFSESFYGAIQRSHLESGRRVRLKPEPRKGEAELRGQWLAPFIISPHNPRVIYHGMNHLYRSMDRGANWERISDDLSYADASKLGDIPYQTITTVSESPLKFGLVYAGTDDGRLHVRDPSGTWAEITAGLAPHRWMSRVEASRFNRDTVYVAQNGKRWDDFDAYLWRSTDRGATWQDISKGIPGGPVNVIREDPKDPRILYVGTDVGVYVTTDGARTWNVLANGLDSTFVHDLIIHPRDHIMVIATHGRGMYALDVLPIRGEEVPASRPEEKDDEEEEEDGGK